MNHEKLDPIKLKLFTQPDVTPRKHKPENIKLFRSLQLKDDDCLYNTTKYFYKDVVMVCVRTSTFSTTL